MALGRIGGGGLGAVAVGAGLWALSKFRASSAAACSSIFHLAAIRVMLPRRRLAPASAPDFRAVDSSCLVAVLVLSPWNVAPSAVDKGAPHASNHGGGGGGVGGAGVTSDAVTQYFSTIPSYLRRALRCSAIFIIKTGVGILCAAV